MTSVGVKIDNSVTRQFGPYCFKILDIAEQLNIRRANNNNLDLVVIDNI